MEPNVVSPMKFGDFKCSLCGKEETGYGHNPEPLKEYGERCCDECNSNLVIPARIKELFGKMNKKKG